MLLPYLLSFIFLLSALSLAGPISQLLPDTIEEDTSLAKKDIPGCYRLNGDDMLHCPGQSPAYRFEKSTKNSAPAPTGKPCFQIGDSDMTYCPDSGKLYGGRYPIEGRSLDNSVLVPPAPNDDVEVPDIEVSDIEVPNDNDDDDNDNSNPQITPFPAPTKRATTTTTTRGSETVEVTFHNPESTLTLTIPSGWRLPFINRPDGRAPTAHLTSSRSTLTSTRIVTVTVQGPAPTAPAPTGGNRALLPAPPRPSGTEEEPQLGINVTPVPVPPPDTTTSTYEEGVVVPTTLPDDSDDNGDEDGEE